MGFAWCPHCFNWDDDDKTHNVLVNDSAAVFWQHAKDMHPDIWIIIKDKPMRWVGE